MTLTVRSASVTGATTAFRALTFAEMDANWAHVIQSANQNFLPSGTGAVPEDLQSHERWTVLLTDFMSVANRASLRAGSTVNVDTALAKAFALLTASTDSTLNIKIRCPAGSYALSSTASPANSASNFILEGDGQTSTIFNWTGSAGSPVFKFINPKNIVFRDMAVFGNASAKPSALIQFHRAAGQVGANGTGFCKVQRVRLGGGSVDHTKSILTSADGGQDTNNEQHVFEDVEIANVVTYGYHFSHSNSLLHKIVRGSVAAYGTAAISNDCAGANNASFVCRDTAFAGSDNSVIFEVSNPRIAVIIDGVAHENVAATNTKILSCPTAFVSGQIKFHNSWFHMGDQTTTSTIVWNGDLASLCEFHGCSMFAPNTLTMNFTGAGRVNFFGGQNSTTTLTYNGETTLYNIKEGAGTPTYTQAGSGTLRLVRSSGSAQLAVADIITSGGTPSVSGLKVEGLAIFQHGGATNVTQLLNGYAGQIVTFFANNGNTTLVHATGTDNPYLRGGINVTLAAGNCITLRKLGTAIGADVWAEMSRNF